jgi:hypothetical protein
MFQNTRQLTPNYLPISLTIDWKYQTHPTWRHSKARLPPPSAADNEISTDNAEQLGLLEKPEKQLPQIPPPRRKIYLISAKIALVLILAIFYLTFCLLVHYRIVPIGQLESGVGLSFLRGEQYHS